MRRRRRWCGSAVQTELAEDANDHTHWQYRDVNRNVEGESVYRVVETGHGAVRKKVEAGGGRFRAMS